MFGRYIRALTIAGMATLALPLAAHAASTHTVCAGGCDYSTIQAAVDGMQPGDTVLVMPGTYRENVTISKPLTLAGESQDGVVVQPAKSDPDCAHDTYGGSLCGGAASNIILVQANNVTIHNMTLDGDNPTITSGVLSGGVDVEARNGIITNHLVGVFSNLDVHDVTVENLYLRGIYASSGGTFNFHDNVVRNVQGNASSIGMFNFGGSGTFAGNHVSLANDAISSNHSTGTTYTGNVITSSGSGIHTDNAGDSGGSADLIAGNSISDCTQDGWGIFVFVPYIAPTVSSNTVRGCSVGLGAFGGNGTPQATQFLGNTVDARNALSSPGSSSTGVLVTTDQVGFDCGNVNTNFAGNSVKDAGTGFDLVPGPIYSTTCSPSVLSAKINYNDIFHNGIGLHNGSTSNVNAQNNWWGCPKGPGANHCNTVTNTGRGSVQYTPFLNHPVAGNDGN